jgi:hypothetical protein
MLSVYRTNVAAAQLAMLLRIREITGLDLGPETGYPDGGFCDLTQIPQANSKIVN